MKLAPYDSPQRALHSKLRSLRNSVYAHSEVQQQNVRPVSNLGRATAMVSQPVMKLSREEVEMILDMTHITSQAIREKLQSLIERVESET